MQWLTRIETFLPSRHVIIVTAVAMIFGLIGWNGSAQAYLPSTVIGTAALISPTEADSFYGSSTTSTNGLGATTRPPEIIELARALKNNPDLIYEYVRNNIDVVWLYGLHKGALGTSIDKAGTPFDQAMLMVELLRQAGYTASYKAGTITLDGTQFYDWTGIQNAKAACQLLSSGGIPAIINGSTSATCTYSGNVTSVTLGHVWVSVTIGGGTYVFDPSYKPHAWMAGINLVTATGLVSGQPLSAAAPANSGTQQGVSYISGLNAAGTGGLNSKLQTYASNLLSYLQTNNLQSAQMEDIVSGGVITAYTSPAGGLRQTTLPYSSAVQHSWSGNIPDQYRATFNVKGMTRKYTSVSEYIDDTMWDRLFYVDEIYGRLLAVDTDLRGGLTATEFNKNTVYLKLDGTILETYVNTPPAGFSGTVRGVPSHLVLTVNHPYAAAADGSSSTTGDYMDALIDKPVWLITHFTILHGWGDTSNALFTKWADEMGNDTPIMTGWGSNSQSCPGQEPCPIGYLGPKGDATRAKIAASWLAQSTRATQLHAAIAGAVEQIHHAVGVVYGDTYIGVVTPCAQCSTSYSIADTYDRIDVDTALSLTSKTADANARRAAVHAVAASLAALEGSVGQQIASMPDSGSTATRFEWGNAPPAAEDPSAAGARNFMQFTSANASAASSLALTENMVSSSASGITSPSSPAQPILSSSDVAVWRSALSRAISDYAQAGFTIAASQEGFLGPGQRGGVYTVINQGGDYTALPTKQRGGALVATRYVSGEPVEIAHLLTTYEIYDGSALISKGGGAGVTPDHNSQYDPATASDILKSRFIDRSNALGVNLADGSLSFTSPVSLSVGNGGFPYSLQATMSLHAGKNKSPGAPAVPTRPGTPWTTNWQSNLSLSGSGMEAMGQTDVRASAGTIAAFLAEQDIYKAAQSLQRDVAAVLSQSWWIHRIEGNVATAAVGNASRQFVQLASNAWVPTGPGSYATLIVTGSRAAGQVICGVQVPYALSRGWDESGMSFDVTNAQGDVQNFDFWLNNFYSGSPQPCGEIKGFRLTSWVFPQGVTVNLVYGQPYDPKSPDGTGEIEQLIEVNNSLGRKITITNDGTGGITGFNNGLTGGDARVLAYDGTASTMTDPAGALTKFTFGTAATGARPTERPILAQVFTADNGSEANVEYTYDLLMHVKEVKDAVAIQDGGRNPYSFFIADGTRGERDDPLGNAYTVVYDTYGKPARFIDELGQETDAAFDSRGRVLQYVYPEGDQELFGYDDHNNTAAYTRVAKPSACTPTCPPNLVVLAEWDQTWNKPLTITNARNLVTTFTYYGSGNGKSLLHNATRPNPGSGAPVYSFTYTSIGKLDTATDPTGVVTDNGYDAGGNLTTVTLDPGASPHIASTTTYAYEAQGDVFTIADPRGNLTEFKYDLDRRKTQDLHHNGNGTAVLNAAARTTYDEVGRPIKTEAGTVFSGSTVTTWVTTDTKTYTPTGKVETDKDGDNRTTTMAYDGADRTLSVIDPVSRQTRFTYDAAGQTLIETRAYGTALQEDYATYTYTANGKQATVKDANTNQTNFTYDGFDRLITTTFPDTTYEQLTYDADGDVLTRRNRSNQTLTFTYDNLDRMLTKVSPSPALTTTWSYDGAGKIDKICDAASCATSGNIVDYGYDTAGRLTSAATTLAGLTGAKTISYGLDAAGNRTGLTWPDGYAVTYTYDTLNRMATAVNGATTLATYTYNPLSQRTNLAYNNSSGATVAYTWSTAGDLLTLTHNLFLTTNDVTYTETYTNAHQLATETISDADYRFGPGANGTSAYAAANNLNQYPSVNSVTQTYDTRGNLTGDGTFTYTYDAENRLLTANKTGVAATYVYDPLGRRVKKSGTGVTTTYFLGDGDNEITEYSSANAVVKRFVPGPAIDDPIAMVTSAGVTTYFHENKTGSVVAMTSGTLGALSEGPYLYDAYGTASDTAGVPYKFTGRRLDPETGLYYYRARYYDPLRGRFPQTDPVGYGPDKNMYSYTYNDPVNRVDPSGMMDDFTADKYSQAVMQMSPSERAALAVTGVTFAAAPLVYSVGGIVGVSPLLSAGISGDVTAAKGGTAMDIGKAYVKGGVVATATELTGGGVIATAGVAGVTDFAVGTGLDAATSGNLNLQENLEDALATAAGAGAGKLIPGTKSGAGLGTVAGRTLLKKSANTVVRSIINGVLPHHQQQQNGAGLSFSNRSDQPGSQHLCTGSRIGTTDPCH